MSKKALRPRPAVVPPRRGVATPPRQRAVAAPPRGRSTTGVPPKGDPRAQPPREHLSHPPRQRPVAPPPNPRKPKLVRDVGGNELKDLFAFFPDLPRPRRPTAKLPKRRPRRR